MRELVQSREKQLSDKAVKSREAGCSRQQGKEFPYTLLYLGQPECNGMTTARGLCVMRDDIRETDNTSTQSGAIRLQQNDSASLRLASR
jgi:hypothetical protein